jgi:IS5 family transposase
LFDAVPQLGLRFEPEVAALDRLLEDDELFRLVREDLARRYPRTARTGRPSTPVEVILRLLVLKHLYAWSYEDTERFVADSLVLRQFCRLALEPVPHHTTLQRWANVIRPATMHQLLDRVVALARAARVTKGRKLRLDGTVVETDVHHPADSTLLADGVRVLGRLVRRAKAVVGDGVAGAAAQFRDRTRSAARLARAIGETMIRGRQRREAERRARYERLLAVARASRRQATQVQELLNDAPDAEAAAARLRAALDRFAPLVDRVAQTRRRVLQGEAVPAAEKVLGLFEPHTALIRRGKARQATEFGRTLWLDEVEGGIVSGYTVLTGNASERTQVAPSLTHHRVRFGRPPDLLTADRGVYSGENERLAVEAGVRRVAHAPPRHAQPALREWTRQRWFRRAYRWRTGIEGRISLLRRRFGLRRCRYRSEAGMERWVGWGVIAHDLRVIGRTLATRRAAQADGVPARRQPLAHHQQRLAHSGVSHRKVR